MKKLKKCIAKSGMPIKIMATVVGMATMMVAAELPKSMGNGQTSGTVEVKIDNFSFGPASLTVSPGTTVTWTNRDDIPHTVVSTDHVFKSKVLDTDDKFSYTFATAGTFPYFCSIHPKMTAKVVVQ